MPSSKQTQAGQLQTDACQLPQVPERKLAAGLSPHRESLIRYIEKKWVNFTVLHFYFLDNPAHWRGAEEQKQAVRDAFQHWKDLGIGLEFDEVQDADLAEIRIGFALGEGSWSYVGRDNLQYAPDPNERTMNFGWDLTTPYGRDTALHEIGHALGFPHEHQNPNAGIVWDEPAVLTEFSGPPNNWSEQQIRWNILRKLNPGEVQGSNWDKDSIMHYQFRAGLITSPPQFQTQHLIPEPGLSEVDISEVCKLYPPAQAKLPELRPFESHLVKIAPAEQLDFLIKPKKTQRYQMQTFGRMDTLLVLFEDIDGEPVYMAADDDSGNQYNAKITERLVAGRTYYLRLRLYFSNAQGIGAVMLW